MITEQLFYKTPSSGCFCFRILSMAASIFIYSFCKFWPSLETKTSIDVKYYLLLRFLEALFRVIQSFYGWSFFSLWVPLFLWDPFFVGFVLSWAWGPGLSLVLRGCRRISCNFPFMRTKWLFIIVWTLVWRAGCVLLVFFCSRKKAKFMPKATYFNAKIIFAFCICPCWTLYKLKQ